MYKVIIVDDEPAIRTGLKTLIDWGLYGYVVAGAAGNGREALAQHQEIKPDLMIVDIRMPGMNGLELIEEIRLTDPYCHFLILSGYADFDYAKRAISNGVDGYILKPVDELEMIAEIVKIHTFLQREAESRANDSANVEDQREKQICALLFGESNSVKRESLEDDNILTGKAMGAYQILLLEQRENTDKNSRRFNALKEHLSKDLERSGRGIVFSIDTYLGILLYDVLSTETKRSTLIAEINLAIADPEFVYDIAAGKIVLKLADIRQSFIEASLLLKYRYFFGGKPIIFNENTKLWELVTNRSEEVTAPDFTAIAVRLFYAVDLGNKIELEHWIELAGIGIAAFNASELYLKASFGQLISTVLNKLAGMDHEMKGIVQKYIPLITELYEQCNFTVMKLLVLSRLLELTNEVCNRSNQPVLKQIIDFIERHYSENLKLETLAELYNYNSGYLGKIFKNYTGCQFHTYLDKIRIKKAIGLLGTGLKVRQVAAQVGYANVDYFHSKFKKYVGDSPSSFKGKPKEEVMR